MSNIGEHIIQLRKAKKWSQEQLANQVGSSRVMIGNYERSDHTPSIDVVVKIAKAFGVSVDYLVGEGLNASFDKETLERLENIETLPSEQRKRIFEYIDLIVRDHKARQAYS